MEGSVFAMTYEELKAAYEPMRISIAHGAQIK